MNTVPRKKTTQAAENFALSTTSATVAAVVAAVVVEWSYDSKRIIIVRGADLSECFR